MLKNRKNSMAYVNFAKRQLKNRGAGCFIVYIYKVVIRLINYGAVTPPPQLIHFQRVMQVSDKQCFREQDIFRRELFGYGDFAHIFEVA
jgi:hypothetical protein